MPVPTHGSFSSPPELHTFDAVLSDFDGTILDSTAAVVKFWHRFGAEAGVSPEETLTTSHGRRTIDTISLYDTSKANSNYVASIEERIPIDFSDDATEVPGSWQLLMALERNGAKWAIVTSATRLLVRRWINMLALPCPEHLVIAENVEVGKPHPEGYFLGKQLLKVDPEAAVLVLEDAPAEIKADKAAGCKVLAVNTSHSVESLRKAGADWVMADLSSVTLKVVSNSRVQFEFVNMFCEST